MSGNAFILASALGILGPRCSMPTPDDDRGGPINNHTAWPSGSAATPVQRSQVSRLNMAATLPGGLPARERNGFSPFRSSLP